MSSTNSSHNSTRKLLAVMLLALFLGVTNVAHAGFFDFVTSAASAFQSQMAAAITSIAPETVAKVPSPVVKMSSKPTLTLTFDSKREESALTALYIFTIKPSVKNIKFRSGDLQILTKDEIFGKTAGSWKNISIKTSLPINQDGSYTLLKDAQNKFEVTVTYNPRVMEAGSYSTRLSSVVFDVNESKVISIVPSSVSSKVTIIGEVSPQITSVTSPVGKKDSVAISGVRFPTEIKVTLKKNDPFDPSSVVKRFIVIKNASQSYVFKVSDHITEAGWYSLFVTNPDLGDIEGKSNEVGFQVVDADSVPRITVDSSEMLLDYDYSGAEANLTSKFDMTIDAGGDDVYLTEKGVSVLAESGNIQAYPVTQTVLFVNGQNTVYPVVIKAGTKEKLVVVSRFNPKVMFAGKYSARVYGVYTGKNAETFNQVSGPSTDAVLIIGETSPYINSIMTPVAQGAKVEISGVRLLGSSIMLDGRAVSPADQSISDKFISFTAKPELLSVGFHTIKLTNPKGESNSKSFEITLGAGSATTTQPIPVVTASATLLSADIDKTSPSGFFPGLSVTGNPKIDSDWRFTLSLNGSNFSGSQSKTIKSITLYHTIYGEGWSTSASTANKLGISLYPLFVSGKGFETSKYDQSFPVTLTATSPSAKLDLFGQIEKRKFSGGSVVVTFTDGTSVSAAIPSSTITPGPATPSVPANVSLIPNSVNPLPATHIFNSSFELSKVPMVAFGLKGEGANSVVTTIYANSVSNHTYGKAIALYLYEGSTLISSKSVVSATTTFDLLDLAIPKDTTKTFLVKADFFATSTPTATYSRVFVTGAHFKRPDGSTGFSANTVLGEVQTLLASTTAGNDF